MWTKGRDWSGKLLWRGRREEEEEREMNELSGKRREGKGKKKGKGGGMLGGGNGGWEAVSVNHTQSVGWCLQSPSVSMLQKIMLNFHI